MQNEKNDKNNEIREIVSQMTLEEKASLASGKSFWVTQDIERLGIPSVLMTDGPHGIRKVDETRHNNVMQESRKATCFPPAVTVASSWNREIAYEMGRALAEEAKAEGITTVLGPGVNIKRSPLCGRNFEYYSEDPYLSGEMGAAFVNGVQSQNVGTSLKHYCANNQECLRMTISAETDERTLREIYLPAFEKVVKDAKPTTVMCSYNRVNGLHLSDNKKYLTDILRNEWGFDGIVVSDWGAVNDRVKGVEAGLDLQMPSSIPDNRLITEAVKTGALDESKLDEATARVVKFALECQKKLEPNYTYDREEHHALARRIATDGAVLLKNQDDILPLDKHEGSFLIIGALAKNMRYQGAGSSKINPHKVISFISHLDAAGIKYKYTDGYSLKGGGYKKSLLLKAREAAKTAKTVIIFAGLTPKYEGEGYDRKHLNLPEGQTNLINEICMVNKNVIVVLAGGAPVKTPFIGNVKAVLNLYLGGQACGEAAADLLFGDVNPSGKLAETYPATLGDVFASNYFPMGPRTVEYRESVYVGYRYFDSAKKAVLFPFGHGLSYTEFEYSNISFSHDRIDENTPLKVSVDITNVGKRRGGEIVQLYVKDVASTIFRPEKELRAFDKVYLDPEETKTLEFTLDSRAFAYYNVDISGWAVESGAFEIQIGSSSKDIRLKKSVEFVSLKKVAHPDYKKSMPSYYKIGTVLAVPDSEFEKLTGRKVDPNLPYKKGEFDLNSTVQDLRVTTFGRLLYTGLRIGAKIIGRKSENKYMLINGVPYMPVRSISMYNAKFIKLVLRLSNGKRK